MKIVLLYFYRWYSNDGSGEDIHEDIIFKSRRRVAIDAFYPRTLSVIVDTGRQYYPGAPRPEGCEILDALEML